EAPPKRSLKIETLRKSLLDLRLQQPLSRRRPPRPEKQRLKRHPGKKLQSNPVFKRQEQNRTPRYKTDYKKKKRIIKETRRQADQGIHLRRFRSGWLPCNNLRRIDRFHNHHYISSSQISQNMNF